MGYRSTNGPVAVGSQEQSVQIGNLVTWYTIEMVVVADPSASSAMAKPGYSDL